ncbi:MAG TPA: GspH/FimT family pseudopilin [Blastocatellia bacterium]|nr:GspH/FimT family pseudopilin [Blastocatellia bacterium]
MSDFSKPTDGRSREAGLGLMEAIVGLLVILIVGSVVLHLGKMGFAMYRLNAATGGIAEELEIAREQAIERRVSISVIFDAKDKRFGLDRNGNGRLDSVEAEELPAGVEISEDATVIFARSGNLAPGSKQPDIIISNNTKSRRVSVSKSGIVEVD